MPTIVQSNSGTFNGTSFSATLGSATATGNAVVIIVAGNTIVNTPASFTSRSPQVNQMGHYCFDRTGVAASSFALTNSAGQGTWVILEIEGGAYVTSSSANNTTGADTYTTPALTPTAGSRLIIASIGSTHASLTRTVSGWTNSFTELADVTWTANDRPMQGVATLEVAANGSTAYSTTATYSSTSPGRSAIIAAYSFTSGGGSSFAAAGTAAVTSVATGVAAARLIALGTAVAVATAVGATTATLPTSGTVSAVTTTTGAVASRLPADGTVVVTSGATGSANPVGGASGTATALSAATGAVTARLVASGTAVAVSVTTGTTTARLSASGTVTVVSATTGTADPNGGASGTVTATSGVTGAATAILPAAGTAESVSVVTCATTARLPATGVVVVVSGARLTSVPIPDWDDTLTLTPTTPVLTVTATTRALTLTPTTPVLTLED